MKCPCWIDSFCRLCMFLISWIHLLMAEWNWKHQLIFNQVHGFKKDCLDPVQGQTFPTWRGRTVVTLSVLKLVDLGSNPSTSFVPEQQGLSWPSAGSNLSYMTCWYSGYSFSLKVGGYWVQIPVPALSLNSKDCLNPVQGQTFPTWHVGTVVTLSVLKLVDTGFKSQYRLCPWIARTVSTQCRVKPFLHDMVVRWLSFRFTSQYQLLPQSSRWNRAQW